MYYSITDCANKVTDYQVEVMLLMDVGYDLLTNEGSNFSCWLEIEQQPVNFAVRKDSSNVLHELGLMKSIDETRRGHFRYQLTDKAKMVLEQIDVRKPSRMRAVENKLVKKGFEGIKYSHISK